MKLAKLDRRAFLQRAALVLGGALSTSCVSAVLQRDPSQPLLAGNGGVSVLPASERAVLEAVVDRILPATDTPGALDTGVPDFVEFMLAEGYNEDEAASFRAGLARADSMARERGAAAGFAAASPELADEILREIEAEEFSSGAFSPAALFGRNVSKPFFAAARELCVVGFLTSELGARSVFEIETMPGSFDPCVKLGPGQRPWMQTLV